MAKDDRSRENQSDDWKEKMGMELSGLERPRDFLVAVAFFIGFLAIAAVIAFIAFGWLRGLDGRSRACGPPGAGLLHGHGHPGRETRSR